MCTTHLYDQARQANEEDKLDCHGDEIVRFEHVKLSHDTTQANGDDYLYHGIHEEYILPHIVVESVVVGVVVC